MSIDIDEDERIARRNCNTQQEGRKREEVPTMEVEQGTTERKDEENKERVHEEFKFNADAPEFVPRSHAQATVQECCYYYGPWFNFAGDGDGGVCADWFYFVEGEMPRSPVADSNGRGSPKNAGNVNDALQRIVKQVEYQFSEANLVTSDHMVKFMNKDPEGYVPIATVVSQKKMKSLGSNSFMLAKALRSSPKLDISEDGKKVRFKLVLTEREKEELQLRTVVVENLPDDCSSPKLEKIFSTVGMVKSVRICHPNEPNTPRSYKNEILVGNKLHALVEYETADQAEKAAEKLNDERNWRKGLRVRVMLRRSPRSVMRNRRGDHDSFNDNSDDDELLDKSAIDSFKYLQVTEEQHTETTRLDRIMRTKSLGRVKTRGGSAVNNGRGVLSPTPRSVSSLLRSESSSKLLSPRRSAPTERMSRAMSLCPRTSSSNAACELTRQSSQGPRMPDGTRGFTMGRGKPLS